MNTDTDHYAVLGLPSGEQGAKLTEKEISKAYRSKALKLHPDMRPDEPNAYVDFQGLRTSYEILKDEKVRKLFDDLVRLKQGKLLSQTQQDSYPDSRARAEEERIARKLQEEIARIRSMFTAKGSAGGPRAA